MVLVVSKSTWFGIHLIKNKHRNKIHHVNRVGKQTLKQQYFISDGNDQRS